MPKRRRKPPNTGNDLDQQDTIWTRRGFLIPVWVYKFRFALEVVADRDFLILMLCSILTLANYYSTKCSAISSLVQLRNIDDFYIVASDFVISLCLPKGLLLTCYSFISLVICLVQFIQTVVFCTSDHRLHLEDHVAWYYTFLLLYGCKLYLLVLLLKRFSVTLQSLLLLQGEDSVSIFPITITYYTRRSLYMIDYASGSLLTLRLIIEELEKTFLKRQNEVLAEGNPDNKVYYDDNMDITALYITTTRQLQQCKADHEKLEEEFDCYRQTAENKTNMLHKQVNTLNKELSKLKETKEYIKECRCCVCQDNQSNILLRPCNHLSLCEECLKRVKNDRKNACPLCRKKIKEAIKVFS